ncbi:MAG: CHAT domain-containing protein, partial [Candidatus Viridilinea halotolerans]
EASIPWELVRPFGKEWQESFWCETFHFARWLPRHPDVAEQFAPAIRVSAAQVALLAPESYSELQAIKGERALLEALIARHRLQNQSPRRATLHAVRDLLEAGRYDWLHAVSHGNFLPDTLTNSSVLWLEDQVSLSSEEITGQAIINHLAQQRPGFVFNACHVGREGAALSGMDGWASQLVGRGAGLFLAPAWTVTDELAASFATTFYTQLFDQRQTAAAAVWAARQAIKRPNDPTWLAYHMYAHPNLRMQIGAEE